MGEVRNLRRQSRRRRRTNRRARRSVFATNSLYPLLRATLGKWLFRRFNLKGENHQAIAALQPPYLVLANHGCVWDPFMVNLLVPQAIHYVVSDANFRSKLMAFGLSLVGSIPKTKVMSDLETVKNIMRVKEHGGVIGIFPEGQSTWDGHSLPMYYSTAKLAKLLRIPVVTARVMGAFLSKPRWAKHQRRGEVVIQFDITLSPEELRSATAEEIDRRIAERLGHDEYVWNRAERITFHGKSLAEYAEVALFACPQCESMDTLRSDDDVLGCTACGYQVRYDEYGFFQPATGALRFDNMHDWHIWQTDALRKLLDARIRKPSDEPVFREDDVKVEIGYKANPLESYRRGALEFYPDRIDLISPGHEVEHLAIAEIVGTNIQNNERWEFYHGEDLFRITAENPRACTLKWDLGVRLLQADEKAEESAST